jgi:hypothetical protein
VAYLGLWSIVPGPMTQVSQQLGAQSTIPLLEAALLEAALSSAGLTRNNPRELPSLAQSSEPAITLTLTLACPSCLLPI